jgi:hypothetical protein
MGVPFMECAADGLAKNQGNGNPNCAIALNVNSDTTNATGDKGQIERSEITSKSC